VLQGGLLPIASVVIYSHFAVFFMAVIIIVIYIHHSSFSLAVLVYRTRQSPFAELCLWACRRSVQFPRENARQAPFMSKNCSKVYLVRILPLDRDTRRMSCAEVRNPQNATAVYRIILLRRVSWNRNFYKIKRNNLINFHSGKATLSVNYRMLICMLLSYSSTFCRYVLLQEKNHAFILKYFVCSELLYLYTHCISYRLRNHSFFFREMANFILGVCCFKKSITLSLILV